MILSALFAFVHHAAAFILVAMLAIELVLLRGELSIERARQLLRIDQCYGAAAGIILLAGLVRIFYLEKGSAYYFHSAPFIAKLILFLMVGLLSIYPTRELLSWRQPLQQGQFSIPDPAKIKILRRIVHLELVGIVLIIFCAALAARGIGYIAM
jgi:putative membrane protein